MCVCVCKAGLNFLFAIGLVYAGSESECVCVLSVLVCLRIHTCTHITCALVFLCACVFVLRSVRLSVGIPLPLTTLHLAADDAHLHQLLDKLDHLDQSTLDWLKEHREQDLARDF